MTAADIAAVLAVLTLPVPVGILYRRRQAIRRTLLIEANRREWIREEYRAARRKNRNAARRYRQAKREAVRAYHRRNAARRYRITLRILAGK